MLLANGFCKSSEQGDSSYLNIYVFKFPIPEYTIYKDTNLTFDNFIVENMLFAYAIVRDSCDIGFRGFQVHGIPSSGNEFSYRIRLSRCCMTKVKVVMKSS